MLVVIALLTFLGVYLTIREIFGKATPLGNDWDKYNDFP